MKRLALLAAMVMSATTSAALAGDFGFGFGFPCDGGLCHDKAILEKAVFIKYEPEIVEETAFQLVPYEKKVCFKDAYGREFCDYVIDFKKVEVPVKRIVWRPIKVDIHGKPIVEAAAAVAATVVEGAAAPAAPAAVATPGAVAAPAGAVAAPAPGPAPAAVAAPAAPAAVAAPAAAPAAIAAPADAVAPAPATPPALDPPAAAEASILGDSNTISTDAPLDDAIPAPSL